MLNDKESTPSDADATEVPESRSLDLNELFNLGDQRSKSVQTSQLVEAFGKKKRGTIINQTITKAFADEGLELNPSIDDADFYGTICIQPLGSTEKNIGHGTSLSALKDDDAGLDLLEYGTSLEEAAEFMKETGRSKLPLFFDTSDPSTLIGTVKASELAQALQQDSRPSLTSLAHTQVPSVSTSAKIQDWIPSILEHGFIYGHNGEGHIVQIYTAKDVAEYLNTLSKMFLRVYEVEGLVRKILSQIPEDVLDEATHEVKALTEIKKHNSAEPLFELRDIQNQANASEALVDRMTFAHYIKCFAGKNVWDEYFAGLPVSVALDRDKCLRSLNDARIARNQVMHLNEKEMRDLVPALEASAVWLRQVHQVLGN